MNKTHLKRYAPQARKDFIAAVTARAQLLGLSAGPDGQPLAEPCTVQGDVALIHGRPWPARVAGQRELLLERMQRQGFAATLEAVAYTWFNRLAALRYMELHDYLGHGRRVLGAAEGGRLPEVLAHALELAEAGDLPGLRVDTVRELKLANQDGELYRRVLLAQCNALHKAMDFLFEALDDETELLLPDNLLLSDSIVAKLVGEIPEEDWAEVEAIGWLYQFYISEKKDAVIGKVVKSEDIPAATQLFTPNWIVQYLVQNSVGRLWLMANPTSLLASQWPYYIQPAEQTPDVQAQLDALIQTRIREDGEVLNPETITVLDPACGSGHILVVAYEVLKAIYLERGYQPRAIPRLILEKNLYGLDIDDRAVQLAAFALLMKARADDRRLLNDPPKLNVLSLQESKGLDADELATHLVPFGLQRASIKGLMDTFEHAKTFGSLIQIPAGLNGELAGMTAGVQRALQDGDLYARQAAKDVLPLIFQALILGMQFDAVVANPPYMGGKFFSGSLKQMVASNYEHGKGDLYAAFLMGSINMAKNAGYVSMITIPNWMFLSGFEELRKTIIRDYTVENFCHNGRGVFGSDFGSCSFVIRKSQNQGFNGVYKRLFKKQGSVASNEELAERLLNSAAYSVSGSQFQKIPGFPLAYWVSDEIREVFSQSYPLIGSFQTRLGMTTADNEKFLRYWYEVDIKRIAFNAEANANGQVHVTKWIPYQKGGLFRKWFGNHEYVVDWEYDGNGIKNNTDESGRIRSHNYNGEYSCCAGVTWSDVTSGANAFRYMPAGFLFDGRGSAGFSLSEDATFFNLGLLNSKVSYQCIAAINPTIAINVGEIGRIPLHKGTDRIKWAVIEGVREAINISQEDWDFCEVSWGFPSSPLIIKASSFKTCSSSWLERLSHTEECINRLKCIEEKNNLLLIDAYELSAEFNPDVSEDQITLARADREKDCQRLISYAIGCMMGRYSLDEPGLIYAHAGNVGFNPSRYDKKFPADADGIVPITDDRWFEDDAPSRVREFLRAVWGADTLEENMAWLAESLGQKSAETPDQTIRRYLADKFFKDHLKTYKKRPIYWLFSSGKLGAFQTLVYLHRYHEGTLARLRAEYVLPQIAKMQARRDSLTADITAASSTAARTRLTKQLDKLKTQIQEVLTYEEQLRHYADQRITLDLDDGVKVNYSKFGNLLAEVKAVTGGKDEE